MSVKYGFLCFILFMIVLFLAIKNYETWTHPVEVIVDRGEIKKSEARIENPPGMGVVNEPTTVKPFSLIAEKNLFNPARKDFPFTASGSGIPTKSMMRPQIILYGITITGDYQSASIVSPGRPLIKGERELMTLKVGEKIGEYKLAKIFPDRITLEAEGDTFEILLYDSGVPKRRSDIKTESRPASVTSTQPTSVSPSVGVPKPSTESVQSPKGPVPQTVRTPTPVPGTARPAFPPPSSRRGSGVSYPPAGSSATPGNPIPPGTSPQEPGGSK
jgi:hypothetical protein